MLRAAHMPGRFPSRLTVSQGGLINKMEEDSPSFHSLPKEVLRQIIGHLSVQSLGSLR